MPHNNKLWERERKKKGRPILRCHFQSIIVFIFHVKVWKSNLVSHPLLKKKKKKRRVGGRGERRRQESWLKSHGAAYFTFQSRDCNPCMENKGEGLCTAYRSMSTHLDSSQKHLSLLFLMALLLHLVQLLQKLQLATHIRWNFVARVHFVNLHPVLGNDRQLADEVSQTILSSVGNDASNVRGNSIQPVLLGWKVKVHVWWYWHQNGSVFW